MGFLAPIAAPIVGGLFGKLLGGSGQDMSGAANVGPGSPSFQRMQGLGDLSQQTAFDTLLPMAKQAYGDVLPYYQGILGGNRADIMSTLAPEVSTLESGYKNAAKNIGTFTPQGGGMTTLLSELPFKETGDVTNLISGARSNAASSLGALAGQITNEAQGFGNLAEGAFGADINALLGRANQAIPLQNQMGAGIANLLRGGTGTPPMGYGGSPVPVTGPGSNDPLAGGGLLNYPTPPIPTAPQLPSGDPSNYFGGP
jgi:hypothetical protein